MTARREVMTSWPRRQVTMTVNKVTAMSSVSHPP